MKQTIDRLSALAVETNFLTTAEVIRSCSGRDGVAVRDKISGRVVSEGGDLAILVVQLATSLSPWRFGGAFFSF